MKVLTSLFITSLLFASYTMTMQEPTEVALVNAVTDNQKAYQALYDFSADVITNLQTQNDSTKLQEIFKDLIIQQKMLVSSIKETLLTIQNSSVDSHTKERLIATCYEQLKSAKNLSFYDISQRIDALSAKPADAHKAQSQTEKTNENKSSHNGINGANAQNAEKNKPEPAASTSTKTQKSKKSTQEANTSDQKTQTDAAKQAAAAANASKQTRAERKHKEAKSDAKPKTQEAAQQAQQYEQYRKEKEEAARQAKEELARNNQDAAARQNALRAERRARAVPAGGPTFYWVLGLAQFAEASEIKKAFRDLSMIYHPDKNKNDNEAAEEFKAIGEAYSVLSDATEKERYDFVLRYGGQYQRSANA